jgi:hypothetical protein
MVSLSTDQNGSWSGHRDWFNVLLLLLLLLLREREREMKQWGPFYVRVVAGCIWRSVLRSMGLFLYNTRLFCPACLACLACLSLFSLLQVRALPPFSKHKRKAHGGRQSEWATRQVGGDHTTAFPFLASISVVLTSNQHA